MQITITRPPQPVPPTAEVVEQLAAEALAAKRQAAQDAVETAQAAVTQAEQAYNNATANLAVTRFTLLEARQDLADLTEAQ